MGQAGLGVAQARLGYITHLLEPEYMQAGQAELQYLLLNSETGVRPCQAGPSIHQYAQGLLLGPGLIRELGECPSYVADPAGECNSQDWG